MVGGASGCSLQFPKNHQTSRGGVRCEPGRRSLGAVCRSSSFSPDRSGNKHALQEVRWAFDRLPGSFTCLHANFPTDGDPRAIEIIDSAMTEPQTAHRRSAGIGAERTSRHRFSVSQRQRSGTRPQA